MLELFFIAVVVVVVVVVGVLVVVAVVTVLVLVLVMVLELLRGRAFFLFAVVVVVVMVVGGGGVGVGDGGGDGVGAARRAVCCWWRGGDVLASESSYRRSILQVTRPSHLPTVYIYSDRSPTYLTKGRERSYLVKPLRYRKLNNTITAML